MADKKLTTFPKHAVNLPESVGLILKMGEARVADHRVERFILESRVSYISANVVNIPLEALSTSPVQHLFGEIKVD